MKRKRLLEKNDLVHWNLQAYNTLYYNSHVIGDSLDMRSNYSS